MTAGRADGESFPVLRPCGHVINHELSLHVMIEGSIGDREGLPAMGTGPGEDGAVLSLLPHVGSEVDVDAVPSGEFTGMAACGAGNLVFAYLGHNLGVFITEQRSSHARSNTNNCKPCRFSSAG